jgi:hypothetical protein
MIHRIFGLDEPASVHMVIARNRLFGSSATPAMRLFASLLAACWVLPHGVSLAQQGSQIPAERRLPVPEQGAWFDFDLDTATDDPSIEMPVGTIDESNPASTNLIIRPEEKPSLRQLDVPSHLDAVPPPPTRSELLELSQWIRWLALMNLPPNIEDNRKWGKQKEVYNGVDIKMDGWRVDTKRKWKTVNHGMWSRYFIEFVDPANQLQIDVQKLQVHPTGKSFSTSTTIVAPLRLFARVNQYSRDVQLYSISTKADAVVAMQVDTDVEIRINPLVFPPEVEFRPTVTHASIQLRTFDVHEISQIHGDAAEWIGKGMHKLIDRKLANYNDKLVEKMNASIAKQQSKLKLSAQAWFSSSFSQASQRASSSTSTK